VDWQQLFNICVVVDTLIADSQNIYDLRLRDDRILLGLKAQMSEWELGTLRERLNEGAANKARRGELFHGVPVGFRLSDDRKTVELSPDEQVRSTIHHVFQKFQLLKSARQVARALQEEGIRLPRRRDPFGRKDVEWVEPATWRIYNMLETPAYAGAYAWGRSTKVTSVTPEGKIKKRRTTARSVGRRLPSAWPVFKPDHHPAYISWDKFLEIQKTLEENCRMGRHPGPVGDGPSLLTGRVRCGQCGKAMLVSYTGRQHDYPRYTCSRRNALDEKECPQGFGGRALETAVEEMILSVLEPDTFEASLMAETDLEEERTRTIRQWDLEVQRAEETEERARRKFQEVEPGHRLVAKELERQWNEALRVVEEARRSRDLRRASLPPPLKEDEKKELARAVRHVRELWDSAAMLPREKKSIARLLVHHVEAQADREAHILRFTVHWVTGQPTPGSIKLLDRGERALRRLPADDLTIIQKMAPDYTDHEISMILGMAHRLAPGGGPWNVRLIKEARRQHGWSKNSGDSAQFVTVHEAARTLNAGEATVKKLISRGRLRGKQAYIHARWRVSREDVERLAKKLQTKKFRTRYHRFVPLTETMV
jgi:excisionase family DNA binding protein